MKFQIIFAGLTLLVALTSAMSIVDGVKFDLRAISVKFADIYATLDKFGKYITYLNDFKEVEREAKYTANVLENKTIVLKNVTGEMSTEEFESILPVLKDLRASIFKTLKLWIAKKPVVLKVPVNPTQKIYPIAQTKEHLRSLLKHLSDYEKALAEKLPFDRDLTDEYATIKTEIDFAFIQAASVYNHR